MIKDKTVYVGLTMRTATGPAQKDVFATSFGGAQVFGAEIHATAAANLAHGNWIRRAPASVELISEILLAMALTFLLISVSPVKGGILVIGGIIVWALTSFLVFSSGRFIPGGLIFLVIVPIVYLGTTLYYYFVAQRVR